MPARFGPWSRSPSANPINSRAISSATMTAVKISSPMGFLRCPLSASTLVTRPRLESERMPESARASMKSRPSAKLTPKRSEVTKRALAMETATDTTAATKNRPRRVDLKLGRSISSRPTRKKNRKIPTCRKMSSSWTWMSVSSRTSPVRGPRRMPVAV